MDWYRKKLLLFFAIAILLVVVFLFYLNQQSTPDRVAPKEHVVTLTNEGFSPTDLLIHTGDSVRFATQREQPFWPASDSHPIHNEFPDFDPRESIEQGGSWSFTFSKPGKYQYHDHLYPVYRGTIVVE